MLSKACVFLSILSLALLAGFANSIGKSIYRPRHSALQGLPFPTYCKACPLMDAHVDYVCGDYLEECPDDSVCDAEPDQGDIEGCCCILPDETTTQTAVFATNKDVIMSTPVECRDSTLVLPCTANNLCGNKRARCGMTSSSSVICRPNTCGVCEELYIDPTTMRNIVCVTG